MSPKIAICSFVMLVGASVASGCETTSPAEAVVHNGFEPGVNAPLLAKIWYRSTTWTGPIEPDAESGALRVGTGTERAYAIVTVRARSFVAVSRDVITTSVGETKTLTFSADESMATCFTTNRLSAEDYDFVTTRIFPGDDVEPFDASCEGTSGDAGTDAGDASDDG